jgi:transglutaminase-like putative cysteine protease
LASSPKAAPPPPVRVRLHHRTLYRYDRIVALGPQTIRLRPAPHTRTPIESYALTITPARHSLNWYQDPAGNFVARVLFQEPVTGFAVDVALEAALVPINPFDFFLEPSVVAWPFAYPEPVLQELTPFRRTEPAEPRFAALVATIPPDAQPTIDLLITLARLVRERVSYRVRLEEGVQTPEETLALADGSCRDSAWLLVQLLRALGFAARFVSGYLIQLAAAPDSPDGPTADGAELHAWAEAYMPGAGWIGLDATSGLLTSEGHIPLSADANLASAAPISGTVSPNTATLETSSTITRL